MTSIQEMRRAVVVGLVVVGFAVLHGVAPDAMAAQQGRGSAGKKKYSRDA